MDSESPLLEHRAVMVLPHIRVQNANAISSPMTWGFPAITAFTGLMTALERRLGRDAGIAFYGIGVVCHGFEAQVTSAGYTRAFHLTRNPVLADGSTAGIVEEGRVHLDVTLVFDARLADGHRGEAERTSLAERVAHELAGMRLAGGSVMPALSGPARRPSRPVLELVPDESQRDEQRKQFRRLARRCLPGFALVSRDDLLQARLAELRADNPAASALDAWLDLSRWNARAVERRAQDDGDQSRSVEWVSDPRAGWTVPIPVGFAALSKLHEAGTVSGARDMNTPFRFVETVWSMGQWISPHRLTGLSDLVWAPEHEDDPTRPTDHGLYRCRNGYRPPVVPQAEPAESTTNSTQD
jgi:CRISPR-associated protein Csy2